MTTGDTYYDPLDMGPSVMGDSGWTPPSDYNTVDYSPDYSSSDYGISLPDYAEPMGTVTTTRTDMWDIDTGIRHEPLTTTSGGLFGFGSSTEYQDTYGVITSSDFFKNVVAPEGIANGTMQYADDGTLVYENADVQIKAYQDTAKYLEQSGQLDSFSLSTTPKNGLAVTKEASAWTGKDYATVFLGLASIGFSFWQQNKAMEFQEDMYEKQRQDTKDELFFRRYGYWPGEETTSSGGGGDTSTPITRSPIRAL